MNTRSHVHEEEFPVSAEELFRALHTPSAIRQWWKVSQAIVLAETNGFWAAVWGEDEDDPDYTTIARIEVFEPPHRLRLVDYRYAAKNGPLPFEADFQTEFEVLTDGNRVSLRVSQHGFPAGPEADEFYAGCQQGWRDTFAGLRKYFEHRTLS